MSQQDIPKTHEALNGPPGLPPDTQGWSYAGLAPLVLYEESPSNNTDTGETEMARPNATQENPPSIAPPIDKNTENIAGPAEVVAHSMIVNPTLNIDTVHTPGNVNAASLQEITPTTPTLLSTPTTHMRKRACHDSPDSTNENTAGPEHTPRPPRGKPMPYGPTRHIGIMRGGRGITPMSARAIRQISVSPESYISPGSNYGPTVISAEESTALVLVPQTGIGYHMQIGGPEHMNYMSVNGHRLSQALQPGFIPSYWPKDSMPAIPNPCLPPMFFGPQAPPHSFTPTLPSLLPGNPLQTTANICSRSITPAAPASTNGAEADEDMADASTQQGDEPQSQPSVAQAPSNKWKILAQLEDVESILPPMNPSSILDQLATDLVFTPKPSTGFPKTHGDKPLDILDEQEPSQQKLWISEVDSDPRVAIQNLAPHSFLASGLTQAEVALLLDQFCWSSIAITFFCYALDSDPIPRFTCTMEAASPPPKRTSSSIAQQTRLRNGISDTHMSGVCPSQTHTQAEVNSTLSYAAQAATRSTIREAFAPSPRSRDGMVHPSRIIFLPRTNNMTTYCTPLLRTLTNAAVTSPATAAMTMKMNGPAINSMDLTTSPAHPAAWKPAPLSTRLAHTSPITPAVVPTFV
ncbi:hypothetical protein BKA93DRAFT_754626 [Sparassis latifolia]